MKDMLKTGRVVQTRDGAYGIVLGNGISFEKEYLMRSSLNNNLECKSNKLADIMVVFETSSFVPIRDILNGLFSSEEIWRRRDFTEEDIVLAKLIPKKHKYITRDYDRRLFLHESKPTKPKSFGVWIDDNMSDFSVFSENFKSILFDDEEPTLIEDIIKFSF